METDRSFAAGLVAVKPAGGQEFCEYSDKTQKLVTAR